LFSIILVFLILTGIEGQINIAIASETIWFEDWDEGMETAKRDTKPVIVDFIAPACPGCNTLNEKTLSAPEIVQRFKEDWVCIRIHILYKNKYGTYDDDIINYFDIPEYFGVKGLPTLLFFDKNGKHVYSLAGFIDKKRFSQLLDYMKNEDFAKGIELGNSRHYGLIQIFKSKPFWAMVMSVIVLIIGIFIFEKRQAEA